MSSPVKEFMILRLQPFPGGALVGFTCVSHRHCALPKKIKRHSRFVGVRLQTIKKLAFQFCEITGTSCPFYWNKYEASILFVPLIANRKPRSWAICAQFCQLYSHCTQANKMGPNEAKCVPSRIARSACQREV
jgi:hypothetical protein